MHGSYRFSPARIEDYLLSYIRKHSDIAVEQGIAPERLNIDETSVEIDEAYPVSVTLRHLVEDEAALATLNGTNGSNIPNGLFRSNLRADVTDDLLESAKQNKATYVETVRAKYVVGCDGAHSWTRRQIGSVMEGEQTDFIWSVSERRQKKTRRSY